VGATGGEADDVAIGADATFDACTELQNNSRRIGVWIADVDRLVYSEFRYIG
jgi:hypothetical protein